MSINILETKRNNLVNHNMWFQFVENGTTFQDKVGGRWLHLASKECLLHSKALEVSSFIALPETVLKRRLCNKI